MHDYCVAKNPKLRAARTDSLRLCSGQALTVQRTLVRNDKQPALLAMNLFDNLRQVSTEC
jgi:hypothetical protein